MSPVRVELHLLSAINVPGTLEGCGLKKCALAVTAMAACAGSSNLPPPIASRTPFENPSRHTATACRGCRNPGKVNKQEVR
jgi:hypothetical protein